MPVNKKSTKKPDGSSKLYRSEDNRMLGGVCSGLAEFFNIDPTLIRLFFVLITFFGGGGIFFYLVLWLIIPSKSSVSELSRQNFEKNIQEMKDKAQHLAEDLKTGSKKSDSKQILGLFVILFGVMLLLGNLGILNLVKVWKFFPAAIIILLGLGILAKRD